MLAFAAALAVWAIATPAYAVEAPLCDPRAATGIAPAPQLQQSQTSLDVAPAQEDCGPFDSLEVTLDGGRSPAPAPPSIAAQEDAVATSAVYVVPAPNVGMLALGEALGSARRGARLRLDRPPRG
jgi:hypothetical protein